MNVSIKITLTMCTLAKDKLEKLQLRFSRDPAGSFKDMETLELSPDECQVTIEAEENAQVHMILTAIDKYGTKSVSETCRVYATTLSAFRRPSVSRIFTGPIVVTAIEPRSEFESSKTA